jgi:hypothetical protein
MRNLKFFVLAAMVVLICNVAFADLMVELRAVSATGGITVNDSKDVTVGPTAAVGDKVQFQVWANVSLPSNSNPYYEFQALQGWITETVPTPSGAKGDMTWGTKKTGTFLASYVYTTPFTIGVLPQPSTNSAGDREMHDLVGPYTFDAVSASMVDVTSGFFQVGQFTYTLNAVNPKAATALVDFVPYTFDSTGALYHVSTDGGDTLTTLHGNDSPFGSAGPVRIVTVPIPEPSTLILLGMGVLSLLFIRRQK